MSSEGAAAASAAARPHGAASRAAAKQQARAPEGDILDRLTGADTSECAKSRRASKERFAPIDAPAPRDGIG